MDKKTSSLYRHVDTQNNVGQPGAGDAVDNAANAGQALKTAERMAAASEAPKDEPRQLNFAFPVAN